MTQPTPYLLLQPGFPRGTSRPESDAALADFGPAFSCTQDAAFDLLTRSETANGCTEDHGRFCFAAGPDQGDQRAGKNPAAPPLPLPSPEQRLSSRVHATISSRLFCTRFTQTRACPLFAPDGHMSMHICKKSGRVAAQSQAGGRCAPLRRTGRGGALPWPGLRAFGTITDESTPHGAHS